MTTPYPPHGAQHKQQQRTAANATPAACRSANTATSSATFPHSTARPSISAASGSRNSPAPPPSSGGSSNCSAPQCPSPSSSQLHQPARPPDRRHHTRSDHWPHYQDHASSG